MKRAEFEVDQVCGEPSLKPAELVIKLAPNVLVLAWV